VVVAVTDSGLGNADDFRGQQLTQPNRLLIKGERLVKPTTVTAATAANPTVHVVAQNGDLRNLADNGAGHGTAVITCMAADGVGNQVAARAVNNVVMGTAPHVKVRPIRSNGGFWYNLANVDIAVAFIGSISHWCLFPGEAVRIKSKRPICPPDRMPLSFN